MTLPFGLAGAFLPLAVVEVGVDVEPSPYQKPYTPADGGTVEVNPPCFLWVPAGRGLTYSLQISPRPGFSGPDVLTFREIKFCVYTLTEPLRPGRWFWRYGVELPGGKVKWSRARSFSVPPDARIWPYPDLDEVVSKIPKERPRMFVLRRELDEFRKRCREGDLKPLYASLLRRAKRDIGGPLPPEPPYLKGRGPERGRHYKQIFTATRPPMDAMERCALAYLLSGRREFGLEAKRRLLHFFSWDPNGPTSLFHNDEPAMWMMMRGVRAYDWIYDLLSPAERERIESVMRTRAKQFYTLLRRRPFESNPYSSHPGRILGFLGEAALAFIHEWPGAREWLDYVLKIFWAVYPAWAKDDGGWQEGPSYWTAYMNFVLHFVVPLKKLTGIDLMQKPFFRNTPYYKLYTNPPYARLSPFGDGEHAPPGRGSGHVMYLFSTLLRDPYLRWYADFMRSGPGISVLSFVLYDPTLKPKPPTDLPQARYFPGVGLVSLHTALGDPERDIHFLFRSSPLGSISHGHADQNSFCIEAFGEALAIASGYYPWYGSPHHSNWSRETKAHNCITVNGGQGQAKSDITANGKIVKFHHDEAYDYILGDAAQAYKGKLTRFLRHVVHVRPGILILFDDLEAPEPSTFEWWLHALSRMEVDEKGRVVLVERGRALLEVIFLLPRRLNFSQTDEFDPPPEGDYPNQWHLTASTSRRARAVQFLTALLVYKKGGAPPEVRLAEGKGAVGVEIVKGKERHIVGFRLPGAKGTVELAGIRADCQAFAVKFEPSGKVVHSVAFGGREKLTVK